MLIEGFIYEFELLEYTIKYLLLLIQKEAAMIYILLLVIDLERWYKLVKVIINIINFAEVILNIIVCYHGFLSLIIINSGFFLS